VRMLQIVEWHCFVSTEMVACAGRFLSERPVA
jgi:hypothetical protein